MAYRFSAVRFCGYLSCAKSLESPLLTLHNVGCFKGPKPAPCHRVSCQTFFSHLAPRIHRAKLSAHHVNPSCTAFLTRIWKTGSVFTQSATCFPYPQHARAPMPVNIYSTTSSAWAAKLGGSPANKEEDQLSSTRGSKENVLTIPNLLTVSRIGLTPLLGYLIVQQNYPLACGIFVVAGLTDLLDGWIARRYPSQSSAFGSFLDPLADKFLASIVFLSLTWVHLIPAPLTALVVCRDVGLVAAAFYVRYISMTPPIKLASFFDVTLKTAELKPMFISKLNTAIQLSLVALTLAAPVGGYVDHVGLQALWYLTAVTTTATGVGYMFKKDTYQILKKARSKEL